MVLIFTSIRTFCEIENSKLGKKNGWFRTINVHFLVWFEASHNIIIEKQNGNSQWRKKQKTKMKWINGIERFKIESISISIDSMRVSLELRIPGRSEKRENVENEWKCEIRIHFYANHYVSQYLHNFYFNDSIKNLPHFILSFDRFVSIKMKWIYLTIAYRNGYVWFFVSEYGTILKYWPSSVFWFIVVGVGVGCNKICIG